MPPATRAPRPNDTLTRRRGIGELFLPATSRAPPVGSVLARGERLQHLRLVPGDLLDQPDARGVPPGPVTPLAVVGLLRLDADRLVPPRRHLDPLRPEGLHHRLP